jgi:hypothetical protein
MPRASDVVHSPHLYAKDWAPELVRSGAAVANDEMSTLTVFVRATKRAPAYCTPAVGVRRFGELMDRSAYSTVSVTVVMRTRLPLVPVTVIV